MIDQPHLTSGTLPIYHLVPAIDYHRQPKDQPYLPQTFTQEGFIHCTAGASMLLEVANAFFADLADELLVLEIDPNRLTAPLKFEPPMPPIHASTTSKKTVTASPGTLFPHIYGPLNRQAIVRCFALARTETGQWQMPK
jgi:uncharacterized protein (DUF952 family)